MHFTTAFGSDVKDQSENDVLPVRSPPPILIDASTVSYLLRWIGNNTAYTVDPIPQPRVLALTPDALTRQAFSDDPENAPPNGIDERLNALYAPGDGAHGTVYVLECRDVDARTAELEPCTEEPRFLERVLHELVHHVQHETGADVRDPCRRDTEREANRLGGYFLQARHAEDPVPNRAFWAALESRC